MLMSSASEVPKPDVTTMPFSQAPSTSGTRAAYWACQLGSWGLYAYIMTVGEILYAKSIWQDALTVWGFFSILGIAGTHLFRYIVKRRGWLALPAGALVRRSIAGSVLLAFATTMLVAVPSIVLHHDMMPPISRLTYKGVPDQIALPPYILQNAMTFGFWMAAYFSVVILRQRQQAELHQLQLSRALQTAELRLLKSQLNPHFLFNSLNSVRALIADDPGRAQDAVTQLARTLRYTLSSTDELITFERELEIVDDYLALESLRLAERLKIDRHIAAVAMPVRIPVMLLQTIVENAIKHGIAPLPQGGTLRLSADVIGRELVIVVENPRSTNTPVISTTGVGLANAGERLRLLFGGAAALHTDFTDPSRARVTVHLPA